MHKDLITCLISETISTEAVVTYLSALTPYNQERALLILTGCEPNIPTSWDGGKVKDFLRNKYNLGLVEILSCKYRPISGEISIEVSHDGEREDNVLYILENEFQEAGIYTEKSTYDDWNRVISIPEFGK